MFEKVVLYTMLFEVIGLGCGFGPLNNRIKPPLGSILYWLRPDTIRLPPWPKRVPATKGTARTLVDIALYAALLLTTFLTLFADGTGPVPALGTTVGLIPTWRIVVILVLLGVLGLRDKVIFLAARGEIYATLAVTFLFGGVDMIIAAKLVFLIIWMGAATSKLNKHFPFVISTMMSNNPLFRPGVIKRSSSRSSPTTCGPDVCRGSSPTSSTFIEMCVPIALFVAHGGWRTAVAAAIMVIFHLGILTAIPMGVPLEWNVFMIFGVFSLFVGHAHPGLTDLKNPVPVAIFFAVHRRNRDRGQPVSAQDLVFARHAVLRRQLGHHAVVHQGVGGQEDRPRHRLDRQHAAGPAGADVRQGAGTDPDVLGYAFRAMNTHGRALFTLAHRAMAGQNEDDYVITDGERHLQHRHRMEFRRRPHAQRTADRRDAAALRLPAG